MRFLSAAFLMLTAGTALAQPSGNVMHEMTNIGKQKDSEGQRLPDLDKKKDGALFTVVGSGVNTGDEMKGEVTVADDGGPATKAAPAPKGEAKDMKPAAPAVKTEANAAARRPQTSVIGNEPTTTLWEDMGDWFNEVIGEDGTKTAAPASAN